MEKIDYTNKEYKIIFESDNIYYIQMSKLLINEYLKMYSNQEIQKNLFKKSYTSEQILNWLKKRLLDENACIFSMIEKTTNDYIGDIEIISRKDNVGEIIISITPDKQDKHYGTEAISTIIKYGYEKIELNGFELHVYKNNLKAIHCYKKVGFIVDGDGITENDIHMKISR